VRQATVERSAEAARRAPLLAEALSYVAHPGIRTRGTIGGSTAHADPAAEIPATLVALDAEVLVAGPRGERSVAAKDFFVSTFTTALEPGELVIGVRIANAAPGARSAFLEVSRRHGDFALVGAALTVDVDDDELVTSARIVLTNVSDVPFVADTAGRSLVGSRLDAPAIEHAAALAVADMDPVSDVHASADYRRQVSQTLVRRALERITGSNA
jgi:aerobic carbon-monoxide dehydrogenase medium subunit